VQRDPALAGEKFVHFANLATWPVSSVRRPSAFAYL